MIHSPPAFVKNVKPLCKPIQPTLVYVYENPSLDTHTPVLPLLPGLPAGRHKLSVDSIQHRGGFLKFKMTWIPRSIQLEWVPGKKSLKSGGSWCNTDHIIHQVSIGLYKYDC